MPEPPLARAARVVLPPRQNASGVALGVTLRALPVTVIVTASLDEHPVNSEVAVKVKTVVVVKLTVVGSSTVSSTSNNAGDQL